MSFCPSAVAYPAAALRFSTRRRRLRLLVAEEAMKVVLVDHVPVQNSLGWEAPLANSAAKSRVAHSLAGRARPKRLGDRQLSGGGAVHRRPPSRHLSRQGHLKKTG